MKPYGLSPKPARSRFGGRKFAASVVPSRARQEARRDVGAVVEDEARARLEWLYDPDEDGLEPCACAGCDTHSFLRPPAPLTRRVLILAPMDRGFEA